MNTTLDFNAWEEMSLDLISEWEEESDLELKENQNRNRDICGEEEIYY